MTFHERYFVGCAALAVAALVTVSPARAQDAAALNAEAAQNDWPTYHGTYKSYHYSGLDQINTGNVKNLEVAWMHFPERATRGLQSTPLAIDGVLYYSGSYSRVWALDGATGKTIWAYAPDLDEELVSKQTHSPYNRGIAIGQGNLYVGTVDGRLIALDLKTGKQVWDTKLLDSKRMTVGFTGAPLVEGHGDHRRPGRRMARSRTDLRRGRQDRTEEMGVLHGRRYRRGQGDLGW